MHTTADHTRQVDSFQPCGSIEGRTFFDVLPSPSAMVNPMPSRRLDFKALRAHADFARLLDAYGIALQKDGSRPGQFKALCPFHEDSNPSLKVNTEKNIFHCFACGAKGNVLEFVMEMDGIEIREAAAKVADICGLEHPSPSGQAKAAGTATSRRSRRHDRQAPAPPPAEPETPAEADALPVANPPLSFTLQLLQDAELTLWLKDRGIDDTAIERFGLGRVSTRSRTLGGRLAIPLHNREGQLIGYCGRHVGDDVPADIPKYILPKGFRKELEVFNLHRYLAAPPPQRFAVLCESFFSVIRHAEHLQMLSVLGRSIAPEQVSLLREAGITRILVAFDGDEPGRKGARSVAAELAPYFWTRVVDLPDGVKPHHLPWTELRPFLAEAWSTKASGA